MDKKFVVAVVLILAFELLIFAFSQFTLWPEIVLYPWLLNNGFLLYKDIINPYFPLLTWILSVITKIFGYDLHIFIYLTWGYIFISQIVFIFIIQKLFKDKKATIISLLICVILTIIFEGNGLWFDLAVTLPFLLAYYFSAKSRYLLIGVWLGVGLLIKQTVLWAIFGSLFYMFVSNENHLILKKIKNAAVFLFFIAALLAATAIIFYFQGIFSDFFFWAIKLPFGLMQKTPGFVELPTKRNILIMFIAFWPFVLFIPRILKDKKLILAGIFFISTFIFTFPRFGYFHLVAAIPFFSLISGKIFLERKVMLMIYLFFVGTLFIITFKRTTPFSIRFFDEDVYKLASIIKKETKGEPVFLQNSPQQIYFINRILPAKPWASNFPWYFEYNFLQDKTIASLKENQTKWIVLENYQKATNPNTPGSYMPKKLQSFIDSNYRETKDYGNIHFLEKINKNEIK